MGKIAAIVNAAGDSSRMGDANKLLLPLNQKLVIENTLQNLANTSISKIVVVLGHDHAAVKKVVEPIRVQTVYNSDYRAGLTSSIRKGACALKGKFDGIMICMGDMPLISSADYEELIVFFHQQLKNEPHPIVQPMHGNRRGNPVIFAHKYQSQILDHTEPEGCRGIIIDHKAHFYPYLKFSPCFFTDLDTPEDYSRIKGMF